MADAASVLREARRDAGISQRALARLARTSQARISRIESGREDPSVQTLQRLLRACGRDLILGTEERLRPNRSAAELKRGYRETTPVERILRAAELSHALTVIAGAAPRRTSH